MPDHEMVFPMHVRPLAPEDLDWVLDLSARRARDREPFAPLFWRRATDAREKHAAFLGSLIADPDVAALRTDRAFAFGLPRTDWLLIDDAAVEDEAAWEADGSALLQSLSGTGPVRFICPVPERARTALAQRCGLHLAESWWHRDLDGFTPGAAPRPVDVPGARGRLVSAPPVYAPGGPVLLVTEVADAAALTTIEQQAASAGAPVSVVTQKPGDGPLADLLTAAGYIRTCDFFEGTPIS
jgi:hypothetical protein